jgi:hypothetical protein
MAMRYGPRAGPKVHRERAPSGQLARQLLDAYVVRVVKQRPKLVRNGLAGDPGGLTKLVHDRVLANRFMV